jgi:hypothetical protein
LIFSCFFRFIDFTHWIVSIFSENTSLKEWTTHWNVYSWIMWTLSTVIDLTRPFRLVSVCRFLFWQLKLCSSRWMLISIAFVIRGNCSCHEQSHSSQQSILLGHKVWISFFFSHLKHSQQHNNSNV